VARTFGLVEKVLVIGVEYFLIWYMQTKREHLQQEMMLLPPMETHIPKDHPLYRLNRILDLSFVHDEVRDRYCQDNGRPSIDPEVLVRLFLIQAMGGIPHVRELMRQVQVNLAYRWFIGYRLDEKLPDHSTLSRALERFGDDLFNELFERSIAQCKKSGLIEGRVLHVDATMIRADLDSGRVVKTDSSLRESSSKSDCDARIGRFPDGKKRPGYKQQTVADGRSRVILGLSLMPADRHEHDGAVKVVDEAVGRIKIKPEAVCADGAYGSGPNRAAFEDRGIRLVSPPRKPVTYTSGDYFTVEDFKYDEWQDEFECPAGKKLPFIGIDKKRPDRKKYRCLRTECRVCSLKDRCTAAPQRQLKVGINHAALVRLRADSQTESFRKLYRSRAPVIEGVFGEAKQWHGLGRAWRRGLSKVLVQSLLVATVINLKRLAARFIGLRCPIRAFLRTIWGLLELTLAQIPGKPESSMQLRTV
jgi:transposase